MKKIPIYLRDWLNYYSNGRYLYQELAEEYCEGAGEPQDAIYLKEEWKKNKTISDECFREYVDEAYDEYEKVVESREFYDWVADDKSEDAYYHCVPCSWHADDDWEKFVEQYIEDEGVDLVYEFINNKK